MRKSYRSQNQVESVRSWRRKDNDLGMLKYLRNEGTNKNILDEHEVDYFDIPKEVKWSVTGGKMLV